MYRNYVWISVADDDIDKNEIYENVNSADGNSGDNDDDNCIRVLHHVHNYIASAIMISQNYSARFIARNELFYNMYLDIIHNNTLIIYLFCFRLAIQPRLSCTSKIN